MRIERIIVKLLEIEGELADMKGRIDRPARRNRKSQLYRRRKVLVNRLLAHPETGGYLELGWRTLFGATFALISLFACIGDLA